MDPFSLEVNLMLLLNALLRRSKRAALVSAIVLLGGILLFASIQCARQHSSQQIAFATAEELQSFAEVHGLHCQREPDGFGGVFITDFRVSLQEISAKTCKANCGLTPEWKGILWIKQLRSPAQDAPWRFDPDDNLGGKWRIWGNLVVAGDEEFMDRLEAWYRQEH